MGVALKVSAAEFKVQSSRFRIDGEEGRFLEIGAE
jgi:hypothetical protein